MENTFVQTDMVVYSLIMLMCVWDYNTHYIYQSGVEPNSFYNLHMDSVFKMVIFQVTWETVYNSVER